MYSGELYGQMSIRYEIALDIENFLDSFKTQ